jgi:predicted enzyme related to lactoylglutathione lyase
MQAIATEDCSAASPPVHGTFCWNELNVRDVEAAKRFYAETVGWTYSAMETPEGTYWMAHADGRPVAGLWSGAMGDTPDMPPYWLPYLAVDDVDARVARAEAAGAKIVMPPSDIPDVGRIALLVEPTGATVGWMTPAAQ